LADGPKLDAPVTDQPVLDAPLPDAGLDQPVMDAPVADVPVTDGPVPDAPMSDAGLDQPVMDAPLPDLPVPDQALPDAPPGDKYLPDQSFADLAAQDQASPDTSLQDLAPSDQLIQEAGAKPDLPSPDTLGSDASGGTCPTPTAVLDCYTGLPVTKNVGSCRTGVRLCQGSVPSACLGQVTPTKEVCNLRDDDCNGKVDDGLSGCSPTGFTQWASTAVPIRVWSIAALPNKIAVAAGLNNSTKTTWFMRSIDGGKTWTKVLDIPGAKYGGYHLYSISDKTILAWSACSSPEPTQLSTDKGATWKDVSASFSGGNYSYLQGVVFSNTATTHRVTGDLGATWVPHFTRTQKGSFIFGGARYGVSYDGPGTVSHTADGGKSWSTSTGVPGNYDEYITSYWQGPQRVFLGARNANLLYSTDGGKTIKKAVTPYGNIRYNRFAFHSAKIGFAIACGNYGTGPSYLAITHDGGATWTKPSGLTSGVVHSSWCSRAVAVGPDGTVLAGTDGSSSNSAYIWRSVVSGAP